jgi:hypothetical protein
VNEYVEHFTKVFRNVIIVQQGFVYSKIFGGWGNGHSTFLTTIVAIDEICSSHPGKYCAELPPKYLWIFELSIMKHDQLSQELGGRRVKSLEQGGEDVTVAKRCRSCLLMEIFLAQVTKKN